jgi:hypothetical protein
MFSEQDSLASFIYTLSVGIILVAFALRKKDVIRNYKKNLIYIGISICLIVLIGYLLDRFLFNAN